MAKHPESIESVLVALELLRNIPRGRKVTAQDLHRVLKSNGVERSERTIQRLMHQLSEYFDIERDERARPFGYRWYDHAKGWSIPTLTRQESLLLILAERYLKNILPPQMCDTMGSFFAQAHKNLGYSENPVLEKQWLEKVRVVDTTQPLIPAKIDADIFKTTTDALYHNLRLNIRYKNAEGTTKDYAVMPLGLAQQGPRMYLVCRFQGHTNERSLALHRIKKASTGLAFKRPTEFNLQKFQDDGRFGVSDGVKIRLTFHITKKAGAHLLETPLSKDQSITQVDNQPEWLNITATVVDTQQLTWWLQAFGSQVSNVIKTPL